MRYWTGCQHQNYDWIPESFLLKSSRYEVQWAYAIWIKLDSVHIRTITFRDAAEPHYIQIGRFYTIRYNTSNIYSLLIKMFETLWPGKAERYNLAYIVIYSTRISTGDNSRKISEFHLKGRFQIEKTENFEKNCWNKIIMVGTNIRIRRVTKEKIKCELNEHAVICGIKALCSFAWHTWNYS